VSPFITLSRSVLVALLPCLVACGGAGADPPADPTGDGGSASDGGGGSSSGPGGSTSSGVGGDEASGGADAGGGGSQPTGIGLDCSNAADTLLCDDFESGSIDGALWSTVQQNGATVSVTDQVVLDGAYALDVSLPSAGGAEGSLRAKDMLFPLPNNSMWGRAYVHIGPEIPDAHSKLITARGPLDGSNAQYRLDSNGGSFNSRYTTPYINDNVQHGGLRKFGYDPAEETWLCVEWHFDGMQHEMRYWFDGVAVNDMTALGSEDPQWTAPDFDTFDIGWRTFQAGSNAGGYHVYYDAIVIDDERVGCGG
jgi:hypothetical protein